MSEESRFRVPRPITLLAALTLSMGARGGSSRQGPQPRGLGQKETIMHQIREWRHPLALAISLTVVMAACGGESGELATTSLPATTAGPTTVATTTTAPPGATAEPTSTGIVTLSDSGCQYNGPTEIAVGQLRIELTNETTGQFDIHLWSLQDGHDYDELAAHIDEEGRRNEAGEPPLGHPSFATLVAEASAEAGSTSELVTDIGVGTYGMACIYFDQPGSLGGIWSVGPITAAE